MHLAGRHRGVPPRCARQRVHRGWRPWWTTPTGYRTRTVDGCRRNCCPRLPERKRRPGHCGRIGTRRCSCCSPARRPGISPQMPIYCSPCVPAPCATTPGKQLFPVAPPTRGTRIRSRRRCARRRRKPGSTPTGFIRLPLWSECSSRRRVFTSFRCSPTLPIRAPLRWSIPRRLRSSPGFPCVP